LAENFFADDFGREKQRKFAVRSLQLRTPKLKFVPRGVRVWRTALSQRRMPSGSKCVRVQVECWSGARHSWIRTRGICLALQIDRLLSPSFVGSVVDLARGSSRPFGLAGQPIETVRQSLRKSLSTTGVGLKGGKHGPTGKELGCRGL